MRKRPLCIICITLVLIMWYLHTSGGLDRLSDVSFLSDNSVTLLGKIYQCEYEENKQILYLKQTILFVNSQSVKLNNVKVLSDDMSVMYEVGDKVRLFGVLRDFDAATNPGQFDVKEYYDSKKISYTVWNPQIDVINHPDVSLSRCLWKIRCRLAESVDRILPNQTGALIKGMTLGIKSSILDSTKLSFQNAGIAHLLAISGLHLQMLGNCIYQLLKKLKMGLHASAGISGIFLICYGMITGNSVATVRALIMFLLGVGADITGRTYDGWTGIAITAVVIIAGNPDYLSNSGFWLSFCAVSSFLLFREKRKLLSGIIFYFYMLPITLFFFYEIPLYSTVINLFVIPTAGIVLVSGLLGAVGTMITPVVGKILVFPSAVLLRIYMYLCDMNEKIPFYKIVLGKPTFVQMVLYYVILAVMLWLFRKNALRIRRVFVLFLIIPALCILLHRGISGIQITMLDVGQGDSLVIRTDTGSTYLIDGGSSTENQIGEYRILPYLEQEGVRVVDGIFLSHEDADHMNGVLELLELIKQKRTNLIVERLILPAWDNMDVFEKVLNLARELDIEILKCDTGDKISDGEMTIICLHPKEGNYQGKSNEGSLVLRLDYKEFSMLFTGDLEGQAELDLLGTFGNVDVLKVGHHGSKSGSSKEFLLECRPQVAMISCGRDNLYGHPHEEVLERLEEEHIQVYRTDQNGAVTIQTDGEKIDLKTYKQYNIGDN